MQLRTICLSRHTGAKAYVLHLSNHLFKVYQKGIWCGCLYLSAKDTNSTIFWSPGNASERLVHLRMVTDNVTVV